MSKRILTIHRDKAGGTIAQIRKELPDENTASTGSEGSNVKLQLSSEWAQYVLNLIEEGYSLKLATATLNSVRLEYGEQTIGVSAVPAL
jgi:hypothetical protein